MDDRALFPELLVYLLADYCERENKEDADASDTQMQVSFPENNEGSVEKQTDAQLEEELKNYRQEREDMIDTLFQSFLYSNLTSILIAFTSGSPIPYNCFHHGLRSMRRSYRHGQESGTAKHHLHCSG